MRTTDIAALLGEHASSLLDHRCEGVTADQLHLPGPDYIDRVFLDTDRSVPVVRNLSALYNSGRLAGTGYVSILPVDQGIEHSGAASFAKNPTMFDPGSIVELAIEADGFCSVATGAVSKNLIELFFMMEAIKKQNGLEDVKGASAKARPVKHMAVLGAGTMGGGIAQVAADRGINVRMKDINNDALAIGFRQASDIFSKSMKRKKITKFEYDEKMSHISGTLTFSGFKTIDVVVEAIVEDMSI